MKKIKKLIWQIFPAFLVITLLSLLAVSWYASNSLHHFFLDQTAADLKIRALLVGKQIVLLTAIYRSVWRCRTLKNCPAWLRH